MGEEKLGQSSIRGVLVGSDWDSDGTVIRYSLISSGERELELIPINKKINFDLFLRQKVQVAGDIKKQEAHGELFFVTEMKKIEGVI